MLLPVPSPPRVQVSSFTQLPSKMAKYFPLFRMIACCCGSLTVAILCTECYVIANAVGSGHVPGRHWGVAIAASFGIFLMSEIRKWLVVLFPNGPIAKAAW